MRTSHELIDLVFVETYRRIHNSYVVEVKLIAQTFHPVTQWPN